MASWIQAAPHENCWSSVLILEDQRVQPELEHCLTTLQRIEQKRRGKKKVIQKTKIGGNNRLKREDNRKKKDQWEI